jgi:hypothetical protein
MIWEEGEYECVMVDHGCCGGSGDAREMLEAWGRPPGEYAC